MAKKTDVLSEWVERDLTAAAVADSLEPAFEMDDLVEEVVSLLEAGRRPVLVGEAGVGKTSVVHELARRAAMGEGPEVLAKRHLLQFSFRARASGLKDPRQIGLEFQKLIEFVVPRADKLALFFTDFDTCDGFNLESLIQTLALRFNGPILAEGRRGPIDMMMEYSPELEQSYTLVNVAEPDIDRTQKILAQWSEHRKGKGRPAFTAGALTEAVYLTHRFLSRQQLPRKAVDLLTHAADLCKKAPSVTARDVIERFSAAHRVPRWLVDADTPLDLGAMEASLAERVLGQPEAVSSIVSMIGLIKAGLCDMRRPFGVFLFVGPTGVGKTHIAQLLAETLFGRRDRMVRINMADFQGEGSAPLLFGEPQDSRLQARRGLLTQRLMGHPFAVLLLDEFEKAHTSLHDRFLQLMDEGAFINGAGETISCRSLIIIATSNVGAEIYRFHAFGFSGPKDLEAKDRIIDQKLDGAFRFEFLNRFDRVVHFHPLTRAEIRTIALREMEQLERRAGVEQRKIKLEIDESVLDWLTARGYDPDYGARFLRRTIERTVTVALADAIVRENPAAGDRVAISVRQNRIVARVVKPAPAPERKEAVRVAGSEEKFRLLGMSGMKMEAARLIDAALPRLAALQKARDERSAILERMNDPDFWSSKERAEIVDAYRELDVAVRGGERLADPFERLRVLLDGTHDEKSDLPQRLSRALEQSAVALRDWEARDRDDSPAALWLMVSRAETRGMAGEFIEQIVSMELGWARRMHLQASVAAIEIGDGELSRAVLAIEGPGAASLLEMEVGEHRQRRKKRAEVRAMVTVSPMGPTPEGIWPGLAPASASQRKLRYCGMTPAAAARMQVEGVGLVVDLLGADAGVLSHLAHDLAAAWPGAEEVGTARVYGEDGSAHDPRTEVSAVLRDVVRGKLEGFLEGWRGR